MIQKLIDILNYRDSKLHDQILLGKQNNPIIKKVSTSNIDIHVTPFIKPVTILKADTYDGRWKLRQPMFKNVKKETSSILKALAHLKHPYYKRVTLIDYANNSVHKIFSLLDRRNYAITQQKKMYGDLLKNFSDSCSIIPKVSRYSYIDSENMFYMECELIPGVSINRKYSTIGKQFDNGHPDTVAGRLRPYWGTISCINYKNYNHIKQRLIKMYNAMEDQTSNINLSRFVYQELENEPEWKDIWLPGRSNLMINVDDWRLPNIIEQPDGEWKFVKLDRVVVVDKENAKQRFIADLRSQTNINVTLKDLQYEER